MSFQQNVQQSFWYLLLVVAVVTGVMSYLGTYFASRQTRQTEHQKWLRQEWLQSYARCLAASSAIVNFNAVHHGKDFEDLQSEQLHEALSLLGEFNAAIGLALILATKPVSQAAQELLVASVMPRRPGGLDAYKKAYEQARESFIDAVRLELTRNESLRSP